MYVRRNGRVYECVLVDVNTQRDFCEVGGAFPVANIRELIPALRHMIAWARRNYAPVVSSIESHRPTELSDSGYPIACVDGSNGQRKLDFTLFPSRTRVEADNTLAVPIDLFRRYQQVIFRKRSDDLLANPKADCLLTQMPVGEYILFGTTLEDSLKAVSLALLTRAKPVTIAVDACGYWNKSTADLAVRQLAAKGAFICTVAEVLNRRLDRRYRYPRPNGSSEKSRHPNGRPQSGNGRPHGAGSGGGTSTDDWEGDAPENNGLCSNGRLEGHHPNSTQDAGPKA